MEQHAKLKSIISSAIDLEQYELVGIEMLGSIQSPHVCVYVDTLKGGITIDELSIISKHIKSVLDVAEYFRRDYKLEVSSPGLDRPLFTLDQFRRQLGKKVNVKLHVPIEGRHKFKGILKAVTDKDVTLEIDQASVSFPFEDILKAKLIPEIDFGREHHKREAD